MSQYLFDDWPAVEHRLRAAQRVWLGTDFDGTLTHHQVDAHLVQLADIVRSRLDLLAQRPGYSVAVVTGRSLKNIMQQVQLQHLHYAGDHGYEIHTPHWQHVEQLSTSTLQQLEYLKSVMVELIATYPALRPDFKNFTLSLNYRYLTPEEREATRQVLDEAGQQCPNVLIRHLERGSEVLPVLAVNKGTASRMLRERSVGVESLAIFLGDDVTDEDAFRALPDGVTVHVGQRNTAARYRVHSPNDVAEFLARLVALPGDVSTPRLE